MTAEDLVVEASGEGFSSTLESLRAVIGSAGLRIFAEIDHAAAAQEAGLRMPPTVVLLYGNPKAGTPVMLSSPMAALELPLRVLVSEGEDGRTRLAYRPIAPTLRGLGVEPEVAMRLAGAQTLLRKALGP